LLIERRNDVPVEPRLAQQPTYVYDARTSRRGHAMNKMFFSLRDGEGRAAFAADEAACCAAFGLSTKQTQAVVDRDWNAMLDLGGNIFYMFKLATLDRRSIQYLGGVFSGVSEQEFVQMMNAGGRSDG